MFNKLEMKYIKHSQEDELAFRLLYGLAIYGVIYYFYFKPLTIGHNHNFNLYIKWSPIILGLVITYWLRRDFLKRLNKAFKSKSDKLFTYLLLFFMALMYSFLGFGITTEIIFHVVNKLNIKNEKQITYILPIENINSSYYTKMPRQRSIIFNFQNHSEKIKIDRNLYNELKNENIEKLSIEIKGRKGMFDVFYIDDWKVLNMRQLEKNTCR